LPGVIGRLAGVPAYAPGGVVRAVGPPGAAAGLVYPAFPGVPCFRMRGAGSRVRTVGAY
jgi:hypothetical protein